MYTPVRNRAKPPIPKRLSIRDWQKGYISTQSSSRTPLNGLRTALNVILSQDGTVRPRPSRVLYGEQPTGTVLGEITEFTRRVGGTTENYEISIQNVAGTASVYVRKDGGSWLQCTGKTFNTTARCHFCPIRDVDDDYDDEDKVLILNGEDNLSYLDINTLAVIPFTTLTATAAPTLTVGAGLTGTTFTNRYKVTASNRGETAASAATVATTSKIRDSWSAANEYVDVQITRVTGAERYHIYYGATDGSEVYLFSIDDPGSGTTVTWRDTGTISADIYRPAPLGDTTAGPIGTRAAFINGQVFIVGDKNNPKYVRFGGTGQSILDFSPYGGGGFQPVGGNKEVPVRVASFRDNSGSPAITVLCSGTNGTGKRYIFSQQSTTIGDTIISYFAVREENGNDGTEAPDSVIFARDQLWYMSRDGAKTTLTKAQVQTILSTEGVSDLIQPDISRLNTSSLEKACGLVYENRLYWSLPVGSNMNNEIWVLDLNNLRKGAWMRPWEINADWMWLYNDNDGLTHFCTLDNNQIYEFTYATATQDDGTAFPTGLSTGILKFSEDGQEWAKVLRVIFVLQNPLGSINVGVIGKTEDEPIAPLGSEAFTSETSVAGWSEAAWGTLAWSEIGTVPQAFGVERTEIEVEVDEELNWLSCDLSSVAPNTDYELTDIIVEHILVGTKNRD
jgi:hypothetical protein